MFAFALLLTETLQAILGLAGGEKTLQISTDRGEARIL